MLRGFGARDKVSLNRVGIAVTDMVSLGRRKVVSRRASLDEGVPKELS